MMSDKAICGTELAWVGCYKGNYDLVVEEAIGHP